MMLNCIGDCFGDFGENITGVVCSAKKRAYKFGVWIDFAEPDDRVMAIGNLIKDNIVKMAGINVVLRFTSFAVSRARYSGGRHRKNPGSAKNLVIKMDQNKNNGQRRRPQKGGTF